MAPAREPGLMAALKQAVSGRHARMESLPFVTALAGGTLPLAAYIRQLRAMAVIHAALERALARTGDQALRGLWGDRPSRLAHLRRDLGRLDSFEVPDQAAAVAAAQALADLIRRREERPEDLPGVLYVLEGMTLGNATHLPDVLRGFGGGPAHYYTGYGDRTGASWLAFSAAMDALPVEAAGRERLIQTAHRCFDHLETLYRSLHPAVEAGLVRTASMLNPEAGDHPVPDRAEELRAALAAARRCREEFPYFDARYQDRGRAFARSDAAWLATLLDLPASLVFSQVDWLGRILGNRGIPRLCLERQLVDLHEAIGEAWPEGREAARVLRDAAGQLRAERLRLLPEPEWNRLEQRFDQALEGDLADRFRGTGGLILSAVCDQACGIERAVLSLQPWLTAPARFPPGWVAAVEGLFAQARAIAAG